ncbi:hypothetical protein V2G26_014207 [Clonostachys chloroleuca]
MITFLVSPSLSCYSAHRRKRWNEHAAGIKLSWPESCHCFPACATTPSGDVPNRKTARTSRVRGGKPGASNPSLEGRPDCYCWTHERSIEARTLGYAGDASRTEPGGTASDRRAPYQLGVIISPPTCTQVS